MNRQIIKQNITELIYFFSVLTALLVLIIYPEIYSASVKQGLTVFYNNVVPVLFPFFILTKLLTSFKFIEKAGKKLSPLTYKAYNSDGVSGIILSIGALSGYPVGAKLTHDMYCQGHITRGECARITSFSSVSGPMFIIGTVGILLNNKIWALIILISHLLGAIINGFLYRKYKINDIERNKKSLPGNKQHNNDAVYSSVVSLLTVGGFIVIFFMISDMLLNLGIFRPFIFLLNKIFPENISRGICTGIIEMTRGCIELNKYADKLSAIVSCAVISWGGVSVNMQAYVYLNKCGIRFGYFILTKITHCIISTILCFILITLFGI